MKKVKETTISVAFMCQLTMVPDFSSPQMSAKQFGLKKVKVSIEWGTKSAYYRFMRCMMHLMYVLKKLDLP